MPNDPLIEEYVEKAKFEERFELDIYDLRDIEHIYWFRRSLTRAYNQALEDVEKEAESYKQGRLMDIAEQQLKSTLGHDVLYEKKMEGISDAMLHILSIIKSLKGR